MLISRKLTKNKRCVSDFKPINTKATKNNLAFLLVRDTFLILESS